MSLEHSSPPPKYVWKCLNCGYEDHNRAQRMKKDETGRILIIPDIKECPMCGTKDFRLFEL